jgi:lipoprotein-releasing system permease protein
MNFEYFVAKKLIKQKQKSFSKPIVSIATTGIALSIAVMLISIGVLQGFKNQIKDKITGFTSHIHLIPFAINSNNPTNNFTLSQEDINNLYKEENIKTINPYVLTGGAIKTKTKGFIKTNRQHSNRRNRPFDCRNADFDWRLARL